MINTKGYFYFDHSNPKHNIKRNSSSSNTYTNTNNNWNKVNND